MTITYRFYESHTDLELQYDFWNKITKSLPYAWKPTLSPKLFESQSEFNPKSRYFAFDGETLIGYMSFSGKGEFVSLGYPWVLPEYEGEVQEELFTKVFNFAISEEYGGKVLAQRFRGQWDKQIKYFESKGFSITSQSQIIGAHYPMLIKNMQAIPDFSYQINDQFSFDLWKELKTKQQALSNEQINMMNEYYQSIEFDYAVECKIGEQLIAYFGVTIRPDTAYSEILAVAFDEKAIPYFYDLMSLIHNENNNRKVKIVTISKSHLPKGIILEKLGLTPLTEDVMMYNRQG
ncbi:hypothetical protein [Bacillus sp. EAC]|uniref:hypothetical protein n=1 Tax=Bacillus sp. EAC TaxID=1978338 RepID=UPI000B43A157|nr:hypothetical protein [Bacillus sp. EAC]